MGNFKLTDIISKFDVIWELDTWLAKLKLGAQPKELNLVRKFFPLFLEGKAFHNYRRLSEDGKRESATVSALRQ